MTNPYTDPEKMYALGWSVDLVESRPLWMALDRSITSDLADTKVFTGIGLEFAKNENIIVRIIVNGVYSNTNGPVRFIMGPDKNCNYIEYGDPLKNDLANTNYSYSLLKFKTQYFITHLEEYDEKAWFDRWKQRCATFLSLESTINEIKCIRKH